MDNCGRFAYERTYFAKVGFHVTSIQMGFFGILIDGVGRIPAQGATRFDLRGHLGAHVLYCLH